ncbi:MAG TPA: protein kinase, partial [Blastocatellia bacterium]|nr:protein kinase [Blastocatellia bacterium]
MTAERWQQIKQLFQQACEIDPKSRSGFLDEHCATDPELRREVLSLIDADQQTGHLIDQPAFAAAANLLQPLDSQTTDFHAVAGQTISTYELISEIGRGGMGEVYLAYDTRLGRRVALKLLPGRFTQDPERVHRFQREARSASALNHPNILTIHDFGQDSGYHYMATEFVEGQTLRSLIGKPELTLSRSLDIAAQVATALDAAHQAGIIHRDIKPENIMVRPDGYVKVLDFGLAKLTERDTPGGLESQETRFTNATETGTVIGTVSYMSPEHARGLKVDVRTDLFSLGVLLYEMVTGHPPFAGPTHSDKLVAILEREPVPLATYVSDAPKELQRIASTALAKDREQRYQTASELIADLRALTAELGLGLGLAPPWIDGGATAIVEKPPTGTSPQSDRRSEIVTTPTSSAGYIVNEIKRHKKAIGIVLSLLVIAATATVLFNRRAPALAERDMVLLADFDNRTGDGDFDGTLKQALAVQLEQSPFLNFFPDQRQRETLRLMNRPPDDRITRDVGREICQRQGVKAMITGSIARLGTHYVLTLEAVNGQSGDVITQRQAEAAVKEEVLRSLGQAATELRAK